MLKTAEPACFTRVRKFRIWCSGRGDATVIETGQRLGMNNFLTKPFTAAQLKSCIEAVVGRL